MVAIYFFYGLAFFATGIGLAARTAPVPLGDLRTSLKWLAAFGLLHGSYEWLIMAELHTHGMPFLGAATTPISFAVGSVSYMCLLVGGLWGLRARLRLKLNFIIGIVGSLSLLLLGLSMYFWFSGRTIGVPELFLRWIVGMPGAVLLGAALLLESQRPFITEMFGQGPSREDSLLHGGLAAAGLALVGYGASAIVGPELPFFPENILNSQQIYEMTGLRIEVVRTILATALGISTLTFISRFNILERSELETTIQQRSHDLIESENRLRSIIDNLPVALLVTDDTSRQKLTNKTFRNWYGVNEKDTSGKSAHEYLELTDEEAQIVLVQEAQVRTTGKSVSRETERRLADGNEHHLQIEKNPLYNGDGEIVGVISSAIDITALRKAQAAEHVLYAAIDSLPVSLALFDADDRLLFANRSAYENTSWRPSLLIRGTTYETLVRDCAARGIPVNSRDNPESWVAERLEKHRSGVGHTLNSLPDGRTMFAIERKTANGGTVSLRFDVTEQKQTEDRLYQAQKMEAVGRLAGGIAHDFNNMLGAIMGFAEFLFEDLGEMPKQQEYADRVLRAGHRAKQLVHQILAISRAGQTQLLPTDVIELAAEVRDFLTGSMPSSITVTCTSRADAAVIEGDPSQLSQVLMNLVVNARDAFGSDGGDINIRVDEAQDDWADFINLKSDTGDTSQNRIEINRLKDDTAEALCGFLPSGNRYVAVSVEDNGSGIPFGVMSRMFEPFFTTKDSGKGTGLGLSVVQGIVLAHGGALSVMSQENQGTRFRLYFPLSEQGQQGQTPPAAASEDDTPFCRVMIVEDDTEMVDMLSIGLERMGHRTELFTDAVTALSALKRSPDSWDVIISDQHMPKMTGSKFITEARRLSPDTVIILCTGFSDTLTEESARELGADAFFFKPVSLKKIVSEFQKGRKTAGT